MKNKIYYFSLVLPFLFNYSAIAQKSNLQIEGKVGLPSNFKVMACEYKMGNNLKIILHYPENKTINSNKVISTTKTDTQGNFTLNLKTVPEKDEILIIEAQKNLNEKYISLETFLKWNGNNWESISNQGNFINSYTTALVILSNLSDGQISPDYYIKKYNVNSKDPFPLKDKANETINKNR